MTGGSTCTFKQWVLKSLQKAATSLTTLLICISALKLFMVVHRRYIGSKYCILFFNSWPCEQPKGSFLCNECAIDNACTI